MGIIRWYRARVELLVRPAYGRCNCTRLVLMQLEIRLHLWPTVVTRDSSVWSSHHSQVMCSHPSFLPPGPDLFLSSTVRLGSSGRTTTPSIAHGSALCVPGKLSGTTCDTVVVSSGRSPSCAPTEDMRFRESHVSARQSMADCWKDMGGLDVHKGARFPQRPVLWTF